MTQQTPDLDDHDAVIEAFRQALKRERALEAEVVRAREDTRLVIVQARSLHPPVTWPALAEVAGVTGPALLVRMGPGPKSRADQVAGKARQAQRERERLVLPNSELSVTDAAEVLGVSRQWVHQLISDGRLTKSPARKVCPPEGGWPVPPEGRVLGGDRPMTVRAAAKKLGVPRSEVVAMIERGERVDSVGLVEAPGGSWSAQNSSTEPDSE